MILQAAQRKTFLCAVLLCFFSVNDHGVFFSQHAFSQAEKIIAADEIEIFFFRTDGKIEFLAPEPPWGDPVRRDQNCGVSFLGKLLCPCAKKRGIATGKKEQIDPLALQCFLHGLIGAARVNLGGDEDAQHQRGENGEQNEKNRGGEDHQGAGFKDCYEDSDDAEDKGYRAEFSYVGKKALPLQIKRGVGKNTVEIDGKMLVCGQVCVCGEVLPAVIDLWGKHLSKILL